jgi:hypothetical protein
MSLIELHHSTDRGRYFVAERELIQGDLILEEAPYVCVPDAHLQRFVCAQCWKLADGESNISLAVENTFSLTPTETPPQIEDWQLCCEGCKSAYYCSSKCAEEHRRGFHGDFECALLEEFRKKRDIKEASNRVWFAPSDLTYIYLAIQIIARLEAEIREKKPEWRDVQLKPSSSSSSYILTPSPTSSKYSPNKSAKKKKRQQQQRPILTPLTTPTPQDTHIDLQEKLEFAESLFQPPPSFDFLHQDTKTTTINSNRATFQEMWSLVANRDSFESARLHSISRIANAINDTVLSLPSVLSSENWRQIVPSSDPSYDPSSSPIESPSSPTLASLTSFLSNQTQKSSKKVKAMHRSRLSHLICKIECNAFGIWLSDDTGIGMAVYPRSSFFNHSCAPTTGKLTSFLVSSLDKQGLAMAAVQKAVKKSRRATTTRKEGEEEKTRKRKERSGNSKEEEGVAEEVEVGDLSMEELRGQHLQWFFALKDLGKGEELSYSYVSLSRSGCLRRDELKDHYFFSCRCSRCSLDLAIEGEDDGSPSDLAKRLTELKELSLMEVEEGKMRKEEDTSLSELEEEWEATISEQEGVENYVKWILCSKPNCGGVRVTLKSPSPSTPEELIRICKFCAREERIVVPI